MSTRIERVPALPGADPRESGAGETRPALVEFVAEAAADAVTAALGRRGADPGSAGSYMAARALWLAMNMLLGPNSAEQYVVFLAGRFLDEFELKRKGVQ